MKLRFESGQEIIAVDKRGQQVLFLNPEDLSVIAAVKDLPSRPHELLVLESQRKAYVPIYGDGVHGDNPHPNHQVAVIDLDTRSPVKLIDISPFKAPHTGRLARNGLVYLCCEDSAAVIVIDPVDDSVVGDIRLPSTNVHRLAPAHHADEIYTESEEDGLLSVVEVKGKNAEVAKNITLPGGSNGIDASPLHPLVVASAGDRPALYVVDAVKRSVTRTVNLFGHQKRGQIVRYSPDGSLLAVIGDFEPVVSFYDESFEPVFCAEVGNKPLDGCFSPSMDYMLVANEEDATVSVISLKEQRTIGHVPVGEGCEILAYFNRRSAE